MPLISCFIINIERTTLHITSRHNLNKQTLNTSLKLSINGNPVPVYPFASRKHATYAM